ncbi:glycosyltransferase family 2 protein [bacterium]|nr:glycosyltransferase family 2 protein [bacterium]MBU1676667.1 glycosyltransferase family 2 protein [bacterium]
MDSTNQASGDAKDVLHIIIVNWRAGKFLLNCLRSIEVSRGDYHLEAVTVVDNDSSDGSLDGIDSLDLPLRVIRNDENIGFARACNLGTEGIDADFTLFLNPDMVLSSDALHLSLGTFRNEDNERVGILGVQLLDEHRRVSRSCSRFPTPVIILNRSTGLSSLWPQIFKPQFLLEWDHGESRDVDQVMGAYFMVRQGVFDELNGFDERFFMYFEEVDFCFRANTLGWRTRYLAEASALHHGRVSSDQVRAQCLFFSLRSRLLYFRKYATTAGYWSVLFFTVLVEPVFRLISTVVRRDSTRAAETIKAYRMLVSEIVTIISGGRP